MSQEIYVEEIPKSCSECPCSFDDIATFKWCNAYEKGKLTFISDDTYEEKRFEDCPLKLLKDHDKELVEKVLEKTKTFVRENTYICGGNATREDIITSSSYNQALRDVLGFMQTLQKEFEDE